jgi:peptide/nickel transport system substrate-binding protein
MPRRRFLRQLGLGLSAASAAALGSRSGTPIFGAPAALAQGDDARKSTLIVAYNNTINSLDPVNGDYQQSNLVEQALYDTLVIYDTESKLVGRLAEEFALSDDATSVDITLREGVTFHDGAPLTAKDVAYSLDRYMRLGKGVAQFLRGYSATEVQDDRNLTIKLDKPYSLFLGGLAKIYILNSALVEQQAGSDDAQGWLSSNDAGSGPFQLAGIDQSGNITVTRSDTYWDFDEGRPKMVIYRLIKEIATQRDELRAGNLDVTSDMSAQDAQALDGAPGVKMLQVPVRTTEMIYFNMVKGPTTDPAVRKAVRLAFDYTGAMEKIHGGAVVIANGPLPTTMACHPDLPESAQNLEEAKKTLADAGITNLALELFFQPAFHYQQQEAVLLQSNLQQIGVNLTLTPISFPDWLSSLSDWNNIPQMFLLAEFAQLPDPGGMLVPYFMSTSVGTNRSGYSNPKVDELLNSALATGNAEEQCSAYEEAQRIIDEDAVSVNMYTFARPFGFSESVSGFHLIGAGSGPYIPDIRKP